MLPPLQPQTIQEPDLKIWLQPTPAKGPVWGSWGLGLMGMLSILALLFIALNLEALLRMQDLASANQIVSLAPALSTPTASPDTAAVYSFPTILPGVVTTATPVLATATPAPVAALTPNNTIAVPALGISAPIQWQVPQTESAEKTALASGVIHLDQTALPGTAGSTVISGHSSDYPWSQGQYKSIFAPLLKIKLGTQIILNYQGVEHTYTVQKTYEVKPNDQSVLKQTSTEQLILLTCTPLGTSARRLVVVATPTTP